MFRYFTIFIILTVSGYLYDKYKLKYVPDEELSKYDIVRQFLLNGGSGMGEKPILWIHTPHPVNHRYWPSFGSRNTRLLNQPYKVSCVETVVKHCSKSFNIVLIDDYSFAKLIKGWDIDMDKLADPVKEHVRMLALSKLLHSFGGLLLPNSTVVCKDLKSLYDSALKAHDSFSVNMINRGSSAEYSSMFPTTKILGCKKNSQTMGQFSKYLEGLTSTDYTSESDFLGQSNRWLYGKYSENKLCLVMGKLFGVKDKDGEEVGIERLMGNTFIEFSPDKYALYIPGDEILERNKYEWFSRLSQQQLRGCDTIAAKQLLIAQE
jgi:hypothetical protein